MIQIKATALQSQTCYDHSGAPSTTAATSDGAPTMAEQSTEGKQLKDDAAEDPCDYLEGHGAAPFKNQAEIDAEITEKRQALLKMKVALGNDVAELAETQTVVPHDFGYTPSKGGES